MGDKIAVWFVECGRCPSIYAGVEILDSVNMVDVYMVDRFGGLAFSAG
jgi:hypothetical protein